MERKIEILRKKIELVSIKKFKHPRLEPILRTRKSHAKLSDLILHFAKIVHEQIFFIFSKCIILNTHMQYDHRKAIRRTSVLLKKEKRLVNET